MRTRVVPRGAALDVWRDGRWIGRLHWNAGANGGRYQIQFAGWRGPSILASNRGARAVLQMVDMWDRRQAT